MAHRGREPQSLRRRGPARQPYDYVLIVCEGSKTEPTYLWDLAADLQLSNANVVVTGEGGSAPISVVNDAIARFAADPEFDRVYCVFDKDRHVSYAEALDKVRHHTLHKKVAGKNAGRAQFRAVVSVPCFEYWVLLHFEYTTAQFGQCTPLIARLRRHPGMSTYGKGTPGLYQRLKPLTDQAIGHAMRAKAEAFSASTDEPVTDIHELVRELRALRVASAS